MKYLAVDYEPEPFVVPPRYYIFDADCLPEGVTFGGITIEAPSCPAMSEAIDKIVAAVEGAIDLATRLRK